jgi:cell division protein FtsW
MEEQSADYLFLGLVGLWLIIGLVILTSASGPIGIREFGDTYHFIKQQLLLGVVPGLVGFFITVNFKLDWFKKLAWPIYIISLILLILVFIPGIGTDLSTAAQSWILLGNYTLQPAELAKPGLIIFMSYYLSEVGDKITSWEGFSFSLLFGMIPIGLIALQPDIGTATILFGILFVMLFLAGARWSHMSLLALVSVLALGVLILAAPYRTQRFQTFLHPGKNPQGAGYQINQAFLAIGSGGVSGRGLGQSKQKFEYLPEVETDSIFAILAEEMGFIFVVIFLVILAATFRQGYTITKKAPDKFSQLLAGGIMSWLVIQTFLNIGGIVGLIPMTGVPLPFVSYGGTALTVALASIGIIANVSKYKKQYE